MVTGVQAIAGVEARIAAITSRFRPAHAVASPPRAFADALSTAASPGVAAAPAPSVTPSSSAALPASAQRWAGPIAAAAERHGLDPRLLTAVVAQESGFRPDARSPAGAIGLTQLMPGTARELGVDPTDPLANLDGGARYLRQQLDRFGSVPLALAAYNAGPGRVAAAGGIPRITETQRYVAAVTARYARLRGAS